MLRSSTLFSSLAISLHSIDAIAGYVPSFLIHPDEFGLCIGIALIGSLAEQLHGLDIIRGYAPSWPQVRTRIPWHAPN